MISAAFLTNPFLALLSLCPRRWCKRWRQQNVFFHPQFLGRRTRWCSRSMSGFKKVMEKMDTSLLKILAHIESFSREWWVKFLLSHKNRKEVMRNFFKMRKEVQLTYESSGPSTSCTLVQVRGHLEVWKGTPTTQKEHGTNLQDKSRMYILCKDIQFWKDAKASKEEN